jgi:isocitrate lyase
MLWDTNYCSCLDADAANLLTSDIDQEMQNSSQEKNRRRIFYVNCGVEQGDRGLSYAPYADLDGNQIRILITQENLLKEFTQNSQEKMLANCSPSFNGPQNYQLLKWKRSARILLQWDTNSIHYFSWISRAKYKYV